MTSREISILKYLIEHKTAILKELLENFNISKRSFYYSLNNINFYLKKNNLEKISIKKDVLLFDEKSIKLLLNFEKNNFKLNKEDILLVIYLNAVFNKAGLNISNLSKELFVSRNTIKSYMNEISSDFIYMHSKGYFLEISISEKQKLLTKIRMNEKISNLTNKIVDNKCIEKIKEFINDVSNEINLNLNDNIYEYVISSIYCYITSRKLENVNKLNLDKNKKKIEDIYFKYFDKLNNFEHIYDLLVGLSLTPNIEYWLNESFLVGKLIKDVSDKININLTKDEILYDFLLSHIKVCIYRLKNKIVLNDLAYEDLINKKDNIINIIKDCLGQMEETFDIKFTENEIYLLAFHFNASIDRLNTYDKKKVILICGLGYGSSRVLEHNLKENFDIDIVDILPARLITNESNIKKDVDYVLTTVDLDIDAIKINPVLETKDYEKLLSLGIKRKKDKIDINEFVQKIEKFGNFNIDKIKEFLTNEYKQIFYEHNFSKNTLLNYLTEEKVIFKKRVENYEKAIELVAGSLYKNGSINKEYIKDMIDNVKKYGPYIVIDEGIAIPHSNSFKNVKKTDAAILILDEPVYLTSEKYAYIFFTFSSTGKNNHLALLNDFYNLILIPDFKESIKKIKTYKDFITYLKNILIDGRQNV